MKGGKYWKMLPERKVLTFAETNTKQGIQTAMTLFGETDILIHFSTDRVKLVRFVIAFENHY